MSNDAQVTKKVIEVLEDGKLGFADAADKLADSDRADLAPTFRKFSEQRATFAGELERLAAAYGDDIDGSGSVKGTLHRGWMAVKDALSGSDPDGVLDAAEQGEDHAVGVYNDALAEDISPELGEVLRRQLGSVEAAHDQVKALRNAVG
ncbi:MAG: PA2169 family four-helix-bundle protein [Microthrixaceae bacterium]|nr:PA2169 family four-helix-bundle protein [Microthrixaceae bacterium]